MSDDRPRAGEAFLKQIEGDPDSRRSLTKAQLQLRVFAAMLRDGMKDLLQQQQHEREQLREQLQALFRNGREEFRRKTGQPFPDSIEDMNRLARRSGIAADTIIAGDWTWAKFEPLIVGYFEWLADQAAITDGRSAKGNKPAPADYSLQIVRGWTGLKRTAFSKWAKQAGVPTPSAGERTFRFPAAHARLILETIRDNHPEAAVRKKCEMALDSLNKTPLIPS